MDMREQSSRSFRVAMKHTGGYRFLSQASEDGRPHGEAFPSDEPDPVGEASAPATPALLGAALGHCLSASLLEALRHAHVELQACETDVTSVVVPNAEGLPRIGRVEVVIRPVLAAPSPRTKRCEEVFERHCTVTSSVREGVNIQVRVDWQSAVADETSGSAAATTVDPAPAHLA